MCVVGVSGMTTTIVRDRKMAQKLEKLTVPAVTGQGWLNRVLTYRMRSENSSVRSGNTFKCSKTSLREKVS